MQSNILKRQPRFTFMLIDVVEYGFSLEDPAPDLPMGGSLERAHRSLVCSAQALGNVIPGPQQYVELWPFGLVLVALGPKVCRTVAFVAVFWWLYIQKYAELWRFGLWPLWPFGLYLVALGYCSSFFWGPGAVQKSNIRCLPNPLLPPSIETTLALCATWLGIVSTEKLKRFPNKLQQRSRWCRQPACWISLDGQRQEQNALLVGVAYLPM